MKLTTKTLDSDYVTNVRITLRNPCFIEFDSMNCASLEMCLVYNRVFAKNK